MAEQNYFRVRDIQINNLDFFVMGIGLVESAINLALYVEHRRPAILIHIGTCGVYLGSKISINSVLLPDIVSLVDPLETLSYFPRMMASIRSIADADLLLRIENILRPRHIGVHYQIGGSMANPLGIIKDDGLSKKMNQKGFLAENMELFSVASIAEKHSIPLLSCLGVSNIVGCHSHSEWSKNRKIAESNCYKIVTEILKNGII